ncbi:MAG: putative toxin-antitoxin system toxin component, PIN family [Deltaproteobacteria bacterium]|nr:putative toxin-antitoxin system toxin component, PIN family [Deltaproteobacteria bacterium]
MKVFLDTNVLVSAFATRGLCADLFRHLLAEHELIVGAVVLAELRRVLRDRIHAPAAAIAATEALLREHTVVPLQRRHLKMGIKDPDDEWIVASAIAGEADVLVTGDSVLLEQVEPPIMIVNPRGLWEILRNQSDRK